MEKNSYERRAYESVDDRSPSWVTSQKSTENKIQAERVKFPMYLNLRCIICQ